MHLNDRLNLTIFTHEALKVETQIISRMLERIGLKVRFDVLTVPEIVRKIYIPLLDKPPEEQDWDIAITMGQDWYGHTGVSFLVWYTEESDFRWNEYVPVYEEMWKNMSMTVDTKAQEEKVQQLERYVYDRAYSPFIYSPLMLYAVNKEVDFVPYKSGYLFLKETSVTDDHWSVRGKGGPDEE